MKRLVPLAALLLSGCIFGGGHTPPTDQRRTGAPGPSARQTQMCHADLKRIGVAFNPLPNRDRGGGCSTIGTVQLLDIGVPVTNLGAMRCGLARTFSGWARNAVAPAARQILGSDLVKIETFGTYACRAVVGVASNRLSGHAIANAVDISAFVLADGRRISVLDDWSSPDPQIRAFMRVIHSSACKRFGTVLSPDYNSAHRNHFHLEDDGAHFCR
ncbi:extensin-like protein [Hephaestia caeni]|uniref:Extensin-like protein n=1 Tax=Hephaestia caeni TaxID=645617 RepID=A0A397NWR9_9SPHN|nr:extensin family protein [Hephaestia caeni]RIA37841.1 extensin-like protein [Hephaestia caeni]